jgi:hypothetical protein
MNLFDQIDANRLSFLLALAATVLEWPYMHPLEKE